MNHGFLALFIGISQRCSQDGSPLHRTGDHSTGPLADEIGRRKPQKWKPKWVPWGKHRKRCGKTMVSRLEHDLQMVGKVHMELFVCKWDNGTIIEQLAGFSSTPWTLRKPESI